MPWVLTCDCGQEVTAATHDALVAATRCHVAGEHPALTIFPSRRDILAMAVQCPSRRKAEAQ